MGPTSSAGTSRSGWCAEYAATHPNVTLLPSAGPFKGAARNFFRLIRDVDFSEFDFVSFSDHHGVEDVHLCVIDEHGFEQQCNEQVTGA